MSKYKIINMSKYKITIQSALEIRVNKLQISYFKDILQREKQACFKT